MKILEFVYWIKKILPDFDVSYTSIGDGYNINEIKKFIDKNLDLVKVNIIKKNSKFF